MDKLTSKDINLIIESLLFSSCLEITDEWTEEDREQMLNIATKLKEPATNLKNISINVFEETLNDFSEKICKNFSNLNKIKYLVPFNS